MVLSLEYIRICFLKSISVKVGQGEGEWGVFYLVQSLICVPSDEVQSLQWEQE